MRQEKSKEKPLISTTTVWIYQKFTRSRCAKFHRKICRPDESWNVVTRNTTVRTIATVSNRRNWKTKSTTPDLNLCPTVRRDRSIRSINAPVGHETPGPKMVCQVIVIGEVDGELIKAYLSSTSWWPHPRSAELSDVLICAYVFLVQWWGRSKRHHVAPTSAGPIGVPGARLPRPN